MKNVTVTMEDTVADWARMEAARRNTSVSRLIGEMLADKMRHDDAYERAMREGSSSRARRASTWPYSRRAKYNDARRITPSDSRSSSTPTSCSTAMDGRDARQAATGARRGCARCWTRALRPHLATQVLNEFYANARRKFAAADLGGRCARRGAPLPALEAVADRPRDASRRPGPIESRYGFSYWDALIIAAAQQQGCRYLLSEDMQHGQQVDSVQILNPFLVGPEILDDDPPRADLHRPGATP